MNSDSSLPVRSRPLLVLLAAGAGSRFRGTTHKLNAPLEGDTVAGRAIASAIASNAGDVAVVVGATRLEGIHADAQHSGSEYSGRNHFDRNHFDPNHDNRDHFDPKHLDPNHDNRNHDNREAPDRPRLTLIENPRWADGQATSLNAAVRFARQHQYDAIVVGLADQPGIDPLAWQAIARSPAPIAYATYRGRRGHPVLLREPVWDELPTVGDAGARAVIQIRDSEAEAIVCDGSAADIDTTEDLRSWQHHS